jgi:hypothetical protein
VSLRPAARFVVFLILCFCVGAYGHESDDWLYKNSEQLIEKLMPMEPAAFQRSLRWIVSIRIRGPFIDPVIKLTVKKSYSGSVEVMTIRPADDSLADQINQITKNKPNASAADVANSVKLVQTTINDHECSTLIELANQFENLSIGAVVPNQLIMDSTRYDILSQNLYGNHIQVVYDGPGPGARKQEEPILGWVEKLRKLVERKCQK